MARGQPDYGLYTSQETFAGMSDLGELAARLRSICVYDRRGLVVKAYDFEGTTIRGDYYGEIPAGAFELDITRSVSGDQCLKITTSAQESRNSGIVFYESVVDTSTIGAKISFQLPEKVIVMPQPEFTFYVVITVMDGTTAKTATLRYVSADNVWQIRNSDGAYVTVLTGYELYWNESIFHNVKLAIKPADNKYLRFMVDDAEVDLSAYGIVEAADTALRHVEVYFYVYNDVGHSKDVYLDDYVLTVAEPD